ncbi:MAG: porin, partial [Roseobacter sp.]
EIGASYTFSGWTLGGVYGEGDYNGTGPLIAGLDGVTASLDNFDYSWWVVTATGSFGAADVAVFVGDTNVSEGSAYNDDVAYGISGSYPVGAATDITASIAGGGENDLDTAFGIGFDHSLGGGVNLKGMAGQDAFGNTIADLGVIFNF